MEELVAQLRSRLLERPGQAWNHPGWTLRESAVLVPLLWRREALHLLVTRRPSHLRQHAGQISFPGGARDEADATPLHTALRETEEELGIDAASVDVLGMLNEVPTLTDFRIVPFVGVIPGDAVYRANPAEVEEILEVPVKHLLHPPNVRVEKRVVRGFTYDAHFFDYGAHVIWGATGAILRNLLDVAEDLPAWKALRPT